MMDTTARSAGSSDMLQTWVIAGRRALLDMTLSAVLRRIKVDAVPHGFRSTFRDWRAERTEFPGEVAEMALARAIGDKVEAAYSAGICSRSGGCL